MRKLMIGLATVALVASACGKNNGTNNGGSNNGGSNNGGSNNGTANNTTGNNTTGNNTTGNNTTGNNTTGNNTTGNNTTGNNTTRTNNNTTGTNNNTTGTNNNTTGTNNNTTGTNNNTTGPSAECTRYCDVFQTNCANHAMVYADEATCLAACEGFSDDADVDCSPDPTPATCAADIDGVECRIYHAGAAGADADLHCPHAAEGGGGVCDP